MKLAGILILAGLASCNTLKDPSPASDPSPAKNLRVRPLRTRLLKLDPRRDHIKLVAAIDVAGWVAVPGMVIGAITPKWVSGFDPDLSKHIWWLPVRSEVTAPIEALGDHIVLAEREGSIRKVIAKTGEVIWEAKLGHFVVRPLSIGGSTLVATSATQQVYALDYETGQVKWLYDAGAPDKMSVRTAARPLIRDNKAFIGTDKGEIHALEMESGRLLWRVNPEIVESRFHDVVGEMVLSGRQLLGARYDGLVFAIDAEDRDHKTLWKELLPSITNTAFRSGVFYAGCINGDIHAYDASSGRKLWKASTHQSVSSISPGERYLYIGSSNGRISAIEKLSGELVWQDDISGPIDSTPLIYGKDIYFPSGLKVLYGYRLL